MSESNQEKQLRIDSTEEAKYVKGLFQPTQQVRFIKDALAVKPMFGWIEPTMKCYAGNARQNLKSPRHCEIQHIIEAASF